MRVTRRLFLVAFFVLAALCPGAWSAEDMNPVSSFNKDGSVLVMIIDTSQSMQRNDRKRFNLEGARLAVAISNKDDNVGVVRFSTNASVHLPMRTLKDKTDRDYCMRQLSTLPLEGLTNFVDAIRKAKNMLLTVNAPRGASIVFLTDGQPEEGTRQEQKLMEEVQTFIEHGWRIYTIAFTTEANAELLQKMAVDTGGAYFQEYKPEGLLQAFLTVSSDVYNFLMFTGGTDEISKPVAVMEGSKRLVYILIKYAKESKATVESLKRDAADYPIDGKNVYRYPSGDTESFFEVTHVFNPPAGVYQATLSGNPKDAAILNHPPFDIAIMKDCPRKEYRQNEDVACGLRITCPIKNVLENLHKNATVKAVFYSDKTQTPIKTVKLENKSIKGENLFIQGKTRLKLSAGATRETYTIRLALHFDKWKHEKAVSINLLPDPSDMLSVYPSEIDVPPMWIDEVEINQPFRVETIFPDNFKVELAPKGGFFDVNPKSALVSHTQSATFKITGVEGGDLKPGKVAGKVVMTAASRDGKTIIPPREIPVRATFVKLGGEETIDLGVVSRAEKALLPIPVPVEPSSFFVSIRADNTLGPGSYRKIVPEVKLDGEKHLYEINVPSDAPLGKYTGKITIIPTDSRLSSRKRTVRFEVKTNPPKLSVTPPKVKIESSRRKNGWEEAKFKVKLNYYRGVKIALEPDDLKSAADNVIDKTYDITLTGPDGKKEIALAPGEEKELTFKVYVYSDLLGGSYEGQVLLKTPDPRTEGGEITIKVPVVLELKR